MVTKKSAGTKDSPLGTDREAQERADVETEQGFRGTEVDPTPNEAYTVSGVTKGLPTPETDIESARKAREATGLGVSALEAEEKERAKLGGKK